MGICNSISKQDSKCEATSASLPLLQGDCAAKDVNSQLLTLLSDYSRSWSLEQMHLIETTGEPNRDVENKFLDIQAFRSEYLKMLETAKRQGKKVKVQAEVRLDLV